MLGQVLKIFADTQVIQASEIGEKPIVKVVHIAWKKDGGICR